ncbi:unnamed protein product [Rotaria sp. Silwood2]|nr:unnamed protein product [Rotaria sp. Silwood2]CAF3052774.1 unnamed protein product [Rotaria sp. Silwood2]CAF3457704.1 unnamed protein product [Rotaria sp. Silwood2]CAF3986481.1 unnamed protein product [Rotaria sp. Silwood2]CAF4289923.1 unnamed protein product [Rotaria sp. Silwood2]
MIEGHNEEQKVVITEVHTSAELTAITSDDEKTNNQQQAMGKDVGIQTELIAVTLDDEETSDQQHVMSTNVGNNSSPPNEFEMIRLNLNGEEAFDQIQVPVALKNFNNVPVNTMTKNCRIVEAAIEELNSATTNIINDIGADLSPIVGYAEEPLLPLYKACAPLTAIIHNISFYVQLALNETPEQPLDGLTIDESAAIRLYTIEWEISHQSLYSMLNHTLKMADRENVRPYFKYLKLLVTALAKLPFVPPLTIWRGVTKNLSAQYPPGTLVTWWAFSSSTTSLIVLENSIYLGNTGDRTLFSIEALNGRRIGAHSHFVIEDEILLLPGTHMVVQSQFSPAPDLHIVHLKQIIPDKMLLEPPFEGILHVVNHHCKLKYSFA